MSGPKSKRQKQIEALARLEVGPDPANPKSTTTGGRERTGPRRTTEQYYAEVQALRYKVRGV